METVRARANQSSGVPIIIKESNSSDQEVVSTWSNDSSGACSIKSAFSVARSADDQSVINLSHVVSILGSKREFNTSQDVVSDLEVIEANVTYSFCDGTITAVLPTGQAIEVSSNWRVLPPRISRVIRVVHYWSARELSGNHIVENTKTVSTARVSMIVSELANPIVLWAHITVSVRADSMCLQVIPVSIPV
jgi:hypothetical protein